MEQEHSHSANERKIEELEMVVQAFGNEKSNLSEELQAAKEKLHSCEVRCFLRVWLNLCQILKKRVEGLVVVVRGHSQTMLTRGGG